MVREEAKRQLMDYQTVKYIQKVIDERFDPPISDLFEISTELSMMIDAWIEKIDKKLKKLPEEIFKKLNVSYEILESCWRAAHVADLRLLEDFIGDTQNIVDELKNRFRFDDDLINVYDFERDGSDTVDCSFLSTAGKIQPSVLIDIIASNVLNNKFTLYKFMKERGYELIRIYQEKFFGTGSIAHFVFAAAVQRDISEEIRERADFLYHVTSEANFFNILENGKIIPKESFVNQETMHGIIYPPRIYFFVDENYAKKYKFGRSPDSLTSFRILRLHLRYVPDSIRFFYDPLVPAKKAVYTTQEISTNYIDEIRE